MKRPSLRGAANRFSQTAQRGHGAVRPRTAALLAISCTTLAAILVGANAFAGTAKLKSIYFANPLPNYPVWAEANKCFTAETKKLGIPGTTSGPSGLTVNNQFVFDRISQAIANGVGAIIMVPIVPDQFTPLMKQAQKKGILVATLNTGNSTTAQNVELGTNYTGQGKTIVANLAKRPGQQNILVLGNQAGGPQGLFVKGIQAGIKAHSSVHYLGQIFDNADPTKTTDVVAAALTGHPTVNMIVTWEGTATPGVITAINEAHATGKVFGVVNDLTPQAIAGMKGGQIYGISKQNFCGMATGAVDDLAAIAAGKKVPTYIDTGITFVTKSNLAKESP
jgi:ribose transport system substrate-binding protein